MFKSPHFQTGIHLASRSYSNGSNQPSYPKKPLLHPGSSYPLQHQNRQCSRGIQPPPMNQYIKQQLEARSASMKNVTRRAGNREPLTITVSQDNTPQTWVHMPQPSPTTSSIHQTSSVNCIRTVLSSSCSASNRSLKQNSQRNGSNQFSQGRCLMIKSREATPNREHNNSNLALPRGQNDHFDQFAPHSTKAAIMKEQAQSFEGQNWVSSILSSKVPAKPPISQKTKEASQCQKSCKQLLAAFEQQLSELSQNKNSICATIQQDIHTLEIDRDNIIAKINDQIAWHRKRLIEASSSFLEKHSKLEGMRQQVDSIKRDIDSNLGEIEANFEEDQFRLIMDGYWDRMASLETQLPKCTNSKLRREPNTAPETDSGQRRNVAETFSDPVVTPFDTLETVVNARQPLDGDTFTFHKEGMNVLRTASSHGDSPQVEEKMPVIQQFQLAVQAMQRTTSK